MRLIAWAILALCLSQGPSPTSGKSKGQPPKTQPDSIKQPTDTATRGSEARPVVVKVLDSPHRASDSAQHAKEGEGKATSDWGLIGVTGLLVLVGVGQAFLFWWQLRLIRASLVDAKIAAGAARDSADIAERTAASMEDTARRELRAYIGVTVYAPPKLVVGQRAELAIRIDNFGQTPARKTITWGAARIFPYPPVPNMDFSEITPTGDPEALLSCYPGSDGGIKDLVLTREPLTAEEGAAISVGTSERLYGYGTVYYEDVFKTTHHTEFCFIVGGDTARFSYLYSDQHNDAD